MIRRWHMHALGTIVAIQVCLALIRVDPPAPALPVTLAVTFTRDGSVWLDGQRSSVPAIRDAVVAAKASGPARMVIAADKGVDLDLETFLPRVR